MTRLSRLAAATSLAALVGVPLNTASAIEELVVTTRKREENVQEVPLSVTAFSAADIEQANIVGVEELAKLTPGFEMYRSYNRAFERPIIRGKSIIFTGTSPTVSFFINGAYYAGTATALDLSEAERIEVIKGPQSALFGRSTYSGAINIITKLPGDEFTGKATASAATQGQYEFTGSLAGPVVTDVLSVGIYARYYELDNEFRSTIDERKLGEEQNWSVAATAVLTPTDDLEFVLRGIYDERDDGAPASGMQEFRFNNYAERTHTNAGAACTPVAGHAANYEDANGANLTNCGFDYFKGTLHEVPLTVNYAVGELYAKTGEQADHRGVMLDSSWQASDAVKLVSNVSFDIFNRFQFKSGEDGLPNGGARLGGARVIGATNLSSYIIGNNATQANKATFAVVNAHERTDSVSLDLRAEYDDGGAFRALFGFYHYNENVKRYEPRINFGLLATNMTSEQADYLQGVFQNAIDLEAQILCMQEPGCDPTTGHAQFGTNLNTPFEWVTDGAPTIDPGTNTLEKTTNWAFYGRLEYDITSQLTAGFEARYAEDTKQTYARIDNSNGSTGQALPGSTATVFEDTFPFFAPRMTLNWDVTDNNMLYLVAARGNKPGGFNTGSSTSENNAIIDAGLQAFDEETDWSFEVGSKNAFFDQQLIVNVAAYLDQIKGYQLTSAIADDGGNVQSVTVNQGSVKIPGVELEMAFAPQAIEGLTMNFGYAYSNGQFKSDAYDRTEGQLNDVLDDGRRNCSQGFLEGTSPPCSTTGTQAALGSIEGRRLPQTAKHMLNGGIGFEAGLMGDWNWFTRVDANYTGSRFVQVQNLAKIPSATVINAQLGIESENFRIALWGKNIFNEDAPVGASRLVSNDSGSRRTFLIFPRRGDQWGLTLTARF